MSENHEMAIDRDVRAAVDPNPPGVTAAIGQWAINQVRGLIYFTSTAVSIIWQGLRPLTWRRTVRAEFFEQCYQIGLRALPFIMVTGCLVGLGMVFQAVYWLTVFGQTEFTGPILVLVLVREVAPLFVALIVIGRSGSVILAELGNMQIGGQVRMLDAQGIDPFIFLVVPRVAAGAVCMFSLTVLFIAVALGSGFLAGNALGSMGLTLHDFVFGILAEMEFAEFMTIPLKTFSIGFTVALIACTTGLSVSGSRSNLLTALPRGVTKSVLATLLISGTVTLLL